MESLRLHFDLSAEPSTKLAEWRELLDRIAPHSGSAVLVDRADDADVVVQTRASTYYDPGAAFRPLGGDPTRDNGRRYVVWDKQDSPAGLEPGLYCSLPAPLYDPARHRTAPYPFVFNGLVEPFDFGDARDLLAFQGGMTHPIRRRLVRALEGDSRAVVRVQGGGGGLKNIRSGADSLASYVESLRRSKFFLCPRGVGTGSIRLFETLHAARVPIIVSDDYVLPTGIDWEACSIVVAEKEIDRVADIAAEREQDWPAMAEAAHAVWVARYSDEAFLDTLARDIGAVAGASRAGARDRLRVASAFGRSIFTRAAQRVRL